MKKLFIGLLAIIFLLPCGITATALHDACKAGNLQEVEKLISEGANREATDNHGWTPLHRAAYNGYEKVVELLLARGAKVDATNKQNGRTPLHEAAIKGHEEIVRQLTAVPLLLKQSNSINSELSKKALKRLDAHCVGYGDKIFNSFKCLPVPAVEPMQSIICYTLPAKDDIESRYIKAFLQSCYQDLEKNPRQSAFARLFINEFYKNHLLELKLYITIKSNYERTAIDMARINNKNAIANHLAAINNAQSYDELDEDLKTQTENNYQLEVGYIEAEYNG